MVKTDIWVYAHWAGMEKPECIGVLSAQQAKGRKAFSFEYNHDWINSKAQLVLDPDIAWFTGAQYPNGKENFGMFMDSMPDTWGKRLMGKKAAQLARGADKPTPALYDIDYLLGVYDECRMGALRFKLDSDGDFLDDNINTPIPHWSGLRALQHAAAMAETDDGGKDAAKWIAILLGPGSSLGGARPKANILDDDEHAWIAKFPSQNDRVDKGSWEYLVYRLALNAGVTMAESKIEKVGNNKQHTFFTKRFDRLNGERIHFASAMTMTGNSEDIIKDEPASYLDLAEFIQYSGSNVQADLHQLWLRIIFNIAVSNTDDHLRNHGFIIQNNGWRLSPAYDINASVEKDGLALNIDSHNNALDYSLAKSVGVYFQLAESQMDVMITKVKAVVSNWKKLAADIGITRAEQQYMDSAFRFK